MNAREIVNKMMAQDHFSQWLGIEVLEIGAGQALLSMEVREDMCNGFGVAHGGISYSLADSALAFAANSYGIMSMSIETSISHMHPIHVGDQLKAITKEISKKNKVSVYDIEIKNQKGEPCAHFKGTVYHSSKNWS